MKKHQATINLLPNEILLKIFLYLDFKTIAKVTGTQRYWFTMLKDEQFWRFLLARDFPNSFFTTNKIKISEASIKETYQREYKLKSIIHHLIFNKPIPQALLNQDDLWQSLYQRLFPYTNKQKISTWHKAFYINIHDMRMVTNKIQLAARSGYVDILLMLLKKIENKTVTLPSNDSTKLNWPWLWQRSSTPEQTQYDIKELINDHGHGMSHSPLYVAALLGNTEIIKILINHGANIHEYKCLGSTNTLGVASSRGYVEIVKLLIENNAKVNQAVDKFGQTALYRASYGGHVDVVQLLLDNGADVNLVINNGSVSPLFAAAESGHYDVAKLLIENDADVNLTRADGATPLYIAAYKNHKKIIRILIESGANIDFARYDIYATPLYVAAYQGHRSVIKQLCEAGADFNMIPDELLKKHPYVTKLIASVQAEIIQHQKSIIDSYEHAQSNTIGEDTNDQVDVQHISKKL